MLVDMLTCICFQTCMFRKKCMLAYSRSLLTQGKARIPRCPGGLYRGSIARFWLRPELFPGIGVLPGPGTGFHTSILRLSAPYSDYDDHFASVGE